MEGYVTVHWDIYYREEGGVLSVWRKVFQNYWSRKF